MNPWIPVGLCLPPEKLVVEVLAGSDTAEMLEDPAGKPRKRFLLNGRWLIASAHHDAHGRSAIQNTHHWRYIDGTPPPVGAGHPGASA